MSEFLQANLFALNIDAVSYTIMITVGLLALIIGQFAFRQLRNEPNRNKFFYPFYVVILTALVLAITDSLLVILFCWICLTFCLNKLLKFYPDRLQAVLAAKRQLKTTLLADIFLGFSLILFYRRYGSFQLSPFYDDAITFSPTADWILFGIFITIATFAKSATLPFHRWLPDTMDTPSAVSALMHAGILNAGAFLLLKLSPIIYSHSSISFILLIVGSFSASYGALVMMTQNNIKRKLAYSTISQLSLMLFSFGLGAYSLAMFHIIAHSFYKAYTFLTTASVVKETRIKPFAVSLPKKSSKFLILASSLLFPWLAINFLDPSKLAYAIYGFVILIGFTQASPLRFSTDSQAKIWLFFCLFISLGSYSIFELLLTESLSDSLPGHSLTAVTLKEQLTAITLSCIIFSSGLLLSERLVDPVTSWQKKLYFILWRDNFFKNSSVP